MPQGSDGDSRTQRERAAAALAVSLRRCREVAQDLPCYDWLVEPLYRAQLARELMYIRIPGKKAKWHATVEEMLRDGL